MLRELAEREASTARCPAPCPCHQAGVHGAVWLLHPLCHTQPALHREAGLVSGPKTSLSCPLPEVPGDEAMPHVYEKSPRLLQCCLFLLPPSLPNISCVTDPKEEAGAMRCSLGCQGLPQLPDSSLSHLMSLSTPSASQGYTYVGDRCQLLHPQPALGDCCSCQAQSRGVEGDTGGAVGWG